MLKKMLLFILFLTFAFPLISIVSAGGSEYYIQILNRGIVNSKGVVISAKAFDKAAVPYGSKYEGGVTTDFIFRDKKDGQYCEPGRIDTNSDGEAKTTCYSHLAGKFTIDIKRPNGSNVAHPVPIYFDENTPPTAVPTGIPVSLPAKVTAVVKEPVAVSLTPNPEKSSSDEKTQEEIKKLQQQVEDLKQETKKQQEKIVSLQTYVDEILNIIRNAFSFFKK